MMKNNNDFDNFVGYVAMVNDDGSGNKHSCLSVLITALIWAIVIVCLVSVMFGN